MNERRVARRAVLTAAAATVVTPAAIAAPAREILNDASRLNPTPVARHLRLKSDRRGAWIETIRAELKDAAQSRRRVAVGAARHSMGGQSLPRDGLALTFEDHWLEPNTATGVFRVSAGAPWAWVISRLDPLGFSPKVMQSNNNFGVASTFCVNAHGWPAPFGPFGSTVRSIRMLLADKSLVECSRTANAELFALAMGGYGLFGVIVDLDVEMVRNAMLRPQAVTMRGEDFAKAFLTAVEGDKTVAMAYGRLSVTRATFFRDAILTTYRAVDPQPVPLPAAVDHGAMTSLSNRLYRKQIGSETAKDIRWAAETKLAPSLASGLATRNTLMNEPVSNLANTLPRRTDILHEYFIPPHRFQDFLTACREVIPPAKSEFINVTLRYVAADDTSTLAFAPEKRIAAVMSFSQDISPGGEEDMIRTTEALIERIVAIGGAFYLPYRLHARRDQIEKAYPKTTYFVERKHRYDPGLLFRNTMWDTYFA